MTTATQDIAPICRRNLLALARAFARQERVKVSAVWRQAYGDAKIGQRLKSGGSVSLNTYDQLVTFFRNELRRIPDLEPLDPPTPGRRAPAQQQERSDGASQVHG